MRVLLLFVLLLVARFDRVCLSCVQIILISVKVAEWPPFGKSLLLRLNIGSPYIISICWLSYFLFIIVLLPFYNRIQEFDSSVTFI